MRVDAKGHYMVRRWCSGSTLDKLIEVDLFRRRSVLKIHGTYVVSGSKGC